MKGVFAMVLHFRCGFLTAWIPLKRFTLAVWRLAWCFQFLVESGCGFGHFQNSFVELVFLRFAINACGRQQQQCIYNSGFIAIGACVFTTVVYLCIYLQMSVFFHIYIFDDGMWQMVFKRGRGNFHLSQMSFYCDENICEFLVTFTSQRYSLFVRRFMVAEWCTTFLLILVWFRCPWMENDRFYMFLQRFLAFEMFFMIWIYG